MRCAVNISYYSGCISLIFMLNVYSTGCAEFHNKKTNEEYEAASLNGKKRDSHDKYFQYRIEREMVPDSIGNHSYLIDKYKMSEFRKGQFFAFKSSQFAAGMNSHDAELICKSAGKRLCTSMEWKQSCMASFIEFVSRKTSPSCMNAAENPEQEIFGCLNKMQNEIAGTSHLLDLSEKVYEWVQSEYQGRSMAAYAMLSENGKKINCFHANYYSSNFRSEAIGFRCCLDD